jgi:hypothetical protein
VNASTPLSIVDGVYRYASPDEPATRPLLRFTAFAKWSPAGLDVDADDPSSTIEEIDVDARDYAEAWEIARAALLRDFEPDGAIAVVEERLGLYL